MTTRTNTRDVPARADGSTAQPELIEELWLYAGRRLGRWGKPIDAWYPARTAPASRCSTRGQGPLGGGGPLYRVHVERHGQRCTLHGAPHALRLGPSPGRSLLHPEARRREGAP